MSNVLRSMGDRLSIYLPVILMGVLALGSYWLVRNTPVLQIADSAAPLTHEPDYFMRKFSVKTFDAEGRLKSEVFGTEAHHYPDTDTVEIRQIRMRSLGPDGHVTVATADRGLSNGDGSEIQLFGNAVVIREAIRKPGAPLEPRMEFRSDFLHAYLATEQVRSNQPVTLLRGTDTFTANSMEYDNLARTMQLDGRVKGVLLPQPAK